jgi:hypothetical protein
MDQQQPSSSSPDMQSVLGWVVFISRIGAASVEVFLHWGFGQRYFGVQALLVLLLVPLWSSCWPQHDMRPMMTFLGAYAAMLLLARAGTLCRWFRGTLPHSYYSGAPWIGYLVPWLPEHVVKRFVEPAALFAVGLHVADVDEPLGKYLVFAAGCLLVSASLSHLWLRQRSLDVRDAMIEQQAVMRHLQRPNRW